MFKHECNQQPMIKVLIEKLPKISIGWQIAIHIMLWIAWFLLILAMPAQTDWRYMIPFYILFASAPLQLLWVFIDGCYSFYIGNKQRGIYLVVLFAFFCASCIVALLFAFFILMMKAEVHS